MQAYSNLYTLSISLVQVDVSLPRYLTYLVGLTEPDAHSSWPWTYFFSSGDFYSLYTMKVKFSKRIHSELRVLADLGVCQGDPVPTWPRLEMRFPILPNVVLILWQRWKSQLDLKGVHTFYFILVSTIWIYVSMTEGFVNKQVSTYPSVN